jgi:hypothetical protein
MSNQKYFLSTFPLKYQRGLRCWSFRKYYVPPATDDAVTATATASALDLQIGFSFAPTKTAETEIRTHLEVK